ncbi:HNH endonuclease [Sutcliffiella horikoshii]|uniref:HNH endonuclease n=1 Tax=Sutcliffiella horikoshii TaxID=79883 RepID=UPI003CF846CE
MPKHIRKKRYYNYNSKACKKYLRIDFNYECAYCITHEAESIYGFKSFEIDHFKPRSKFPNDPNIDKYDNLYYSCHICNGEKSDGWQGQMLDPCKDEIYGEHIREGMDEKYKLVPETDQGIDYIKTLKLNQKTHRGIRKVRARYQQKIEQTIKEKSRLLENIRKLYDIGGEEFIEELPVLDELENEMKGPYFNLIEELDHELEEAFEKTFNTLSNGQVISLEKVYEEYDLDYVIKINENKTKVYFRYENNLNFNNGIKHIRIPVEQAREWKDLGIPIIILVFEYSNNKIYFNSFNEYIDSNPILTSNLYSIKIIEENNLEINFGKF